METKDKDVGRAVHNTLGEVRRLLDSLPVAGKENHNALICADNALFTIMHEIQSGHIILTVNEKTEEKNE